MSAAETSGSQRRTAVTGSISAIDRDCDVLSYLEKASAESSSRKHVRDIEGTLVTHGNMSLGTRLIVNIPAHFSEMNLTRTLGEYAKQDLPYDQFEVFVLVNGLRGADLADSAAYKDAIAFQQRNPGLPLIVGMTSYAAQELSIGQIRKEMAIVSMKRAIESGVPDVSDMVLVTNDADVQKLHGGYLSYIVQQFLADPNLSAISGFEHYPMEDFDSDHVFYALQRFLDVYSLLKRRRDGRVTLKGLNAAYRLGSYARVGGFANKHMGEDRRLVSAFKKEDPHSLRAEGPRQGMTIVTSARRQLAALGKGVLLADRYWDFGGEGDIGNFYRVPKDELRIPNRTRKFTDRSFRTEIQRQLAHFYHLQALKYSSPASIAKIEGEMKLAAAIIGIRISFKRNYGEPSGTILVVDGLEKMKELMAKKLNRF